MNTSKPCFASDKDLMIWQENNCLLCKKAVWYNQRLKKMPQYRCAVQKQMEAQAAGDKEINERTYNATRENHCPFFKSKTQKTAEVLDFSQGQSIASEASTKEIEQEAPKETPTVAEPHPDTALLKMSRETGIDYNALKEAERRMFETIEKKGGLPPIFNESQFKKQIKDDTHLMLETFTWKENMMIAFVPLIISHIAWLHADKVLKQCADLRIPETLKLSRAVKHIKQEYIDSLKKDLDARHIERINEQTERFCKEYANDFTILWYCVNAEHMRRFPDDRLQTMRTDAYVSILMCRFLVEHNKRMDKIIEAKLGFAQSIKNPYMDKLEDCMGAYLGENVIQDTPNIKACMRIFQRNLNAIEFEVNDKEPQIG